jgi:hypothetical protein
VRPLTGALVSFNTGHPELLRHKGGLCLEASGYLSIRRILE